VLLLYDRDRSRAISRLITGNCHASCATFGYRSIDEVERFVEERMR